MVDDQMDNEGKALPKREDEYTPTQDEAYAALEDAGKMNRNMRLFGCIDVPAEVKAVIEEEIKSKKLYQISVNYMAVASVSIAIVSFERRPTEEEAWEFMKQKHGERCVYLLPHTISVRPVEIEPFGVV